MAPVEGVCECRTSIDMMLLVDASTILNVVLYVMLSVLIQPFEGCRSRCDEATSYFFHSNICCFSFHCMTDSSLQTPVNKG